jgi:hypothetical protein
MTDTSAAKLQDSRVEAHLRRQASPTTKTYATATLAHLSLASLRSALAVQGSNLRPLPCEGSWNRSSTQMGFNALEDTPRKRYHHTNATLPFRGQATTNFDMFRR